MIVYHRDGDEIKISRTDEFGRPTMDLPEEQMNHDEMHNCLKNDVYFTINVINIADSNADLHEWTPQITLRQFHRHFLKWDRHGIKLTLEWPRAAGELFFHCEGNVFRYTDRCLHIFVT